MTLECNLELHVTKEVTWLKAISVETRIFLIKILKEQVAAACQDKNNSNKNSEDNLELHVNTRSSECCRL
jgi:hypothetical protein